MGYSIYQRGYSIYIGSFLLIFSVSLFCSCTNTRSLPENEYLYTGLKKTRIKNSNKPVKSKTIQALTEETYAYTPNGSILGIPHKVFPFRLWVYTYFKPRSNKCIGAWLHKKLSQPPVLLSAVNPAQRVKKSKNKLFNSGYFDTNVQYEIFPRGRDKRKVKIRYNIDLKVPYTYGQITYPAPVSRLDSLLQTQQHSSLLKPGKSFSLEEISEERKRLVEVLKNQGYFFITPNYLRFDADTSMGSRKVNLTLIVDVATPTLHLQPFSIQKVRVVLNAQLLDKELKDSPADTLVIDGIEVLYEQLYVEPKLLQMGIQFRKGQLYTLEQHKNTLQFLNSLGIFTYINIQFDTVKANQQPALEITFVMTPQQKISLSAGMNMVTKSNGFIGPNAEITFQDINWLKGGEHFSLKLNGGIEWLLGSKKENVRSIFSYALGVNSTLQVPRLLRAKLRPIAFGGYLPNTHINVGVNLLNRVRYYKMIAWNTDFGYQWKRNNYITHTLEPTSLQYVKLLSTTDQFNQALANNPLLAQSFQDQFVLGLKYSFTFNRPIIKIPYTFYLQAQGFTAGNLLSLMSRLIGSSSSDEPEKIFGNIYAQFFKSSADFRVARQLTNQSKLVFRLFGGIGIPYGNAIVLPYNEQFYTGGPNSIRAFQTRSLGPGTYKPATENTDQSFLEQTGEVKVEANLEYRFRLAGWLHGACFLDTGNIWLLREDAQRQGGAFHFSQFLSQMAIGTGLGLRLDLGYIVARWDTGFSLKQPYRLAGDRWIFGASDFKNTLVSHLAIGYPF